MYMKFSKSMYICIYTPVYENFIFCIYSVYIHAIYTLFVYIIYTYRQPRLIYVDYVYAYVYVYNYVLCVLSISVCILFQCMLCILPMSLSMCSIWTVFMNNIFGVYCLCINQCLRVLYRGTYYLHCLCLCLLIIIFLYMSISMCVLYRCTWVFVFSLFMCIVYNSQSDHLF